MPLTHGLLLAAFVVGVTWSIALADVPKPEDIAACNKQAQEATRKGADSRAVAPNTQDRNRAADARRDAPSASPSAGSRAADPQLEGMDPEGAKDPAYQAAYRTCMRKAGF
jgi:hypothetical protein